MRQVHVRFIHVLDVDKHTRITKQLRKF